MLVMTAGCSIALAQEVVPVETNKTEVEKAIVNEVILELPRIQPTYRLKITLQEALKKMENM